MPILLYTTQQVAQLTGSNDRQVQRTAIRCGIGQRFGWQWMFTEADMEKLRANYRSRAGNPGTPRRAKQGAK